MTRTQVEAVLGAFYERRGLPRTRFTAKGLAGLQVGSSVLSFEHEAKAGALVCRSLVYTFTAAPKPKVLERVLRAGKKVGLTFVPAAKALFTEAVLTEPPLAAAFDALLAKLMKDALLWASEKLAASV